MDDLDELYSATDSSRWADSMRSVYADQDFANRQRSWLAQVVAERVRALEPAE
jgi:hypothetical protein